MMYFTSSLLLIFKIKQSFYQQIWVHLEMTENCNSGHAKYGKTIGKSHKQRRGMLFYGGEGGIWEGLF